MCTDQNCYILLENWPLYHYIIPSLSLIMFLVLKSAWSKINITILVFFGLGFAWYVFLLSFYFSSVCIVILKMDFFYTTYIWVSFKIHSGTSLVVQWLRICLPMQEMQVWFLIGDQEPSCLGATKLKHFN